MAVEQSLARAITLERALFTMMLFIWMEMLPIRLARRAMR
jgi:hypothetical protein